MYTTLGVRSTLVKVEIPNLRPVGEREVGDVSVGGSTPGPVGSGPGGASRHRPRRRGRARITHHAQARREVGRRADGPLQARGQQGRAPGCDGRRGVRRARVPHRSRLEDRHACPGDLDAGRSVATSVGGRASWRSGSRGRRTSDTTTRRWGACGKRRASPSGWRSTPTAPWTATSTASPFRRRTLPFETPEEYAEAVEARAQAIAEEHPSPADEYPHLFEIVAEFGTSGYDYNEEFGFGLDLILDGIEQR